MPTVDDKLIGKKIKAIRRMTDHELDIEGWDSPCLVLVLEGNVLLYPSMDTEGNSPGSLFIRDRTKTFVLG